MLFYLSLVILFMTITDTRKQSILLWLNHTLNLKIESFEPASSDASFRRYFRVIHDQGQQIVMDAPPEQENTEPFIRIATLFKKSGLNVPQIYHKDLKQGFLLLEDFGSHCFLDILNMDNALQLYTNLFKSLYQLQTSIAITECSLPNYDEALLTRELDIFYHWFLQQSLDLSISKNTKPELNRILIASALEQPQVCVHRDFHSRNLMVLADDLAGIIDFQDAVVGPITYDLVSLLRDCYFALPKDEVTHLMSLYFKQISEVGLINCTLETFSRWFDLMGLQRHLKAIGIFSRLHLRDNKSDYLADIPRTLDYIIQICCKYPELTDFNQFLLTDVIPVYSSKFK